jgi:hypothetical protein
MGAVELYDSTNDTTAHIDRVGVLLCRVASEVASRAAHHDASKLVDPEKAVFDRVTPRLRGLTYGSEEYKASLAEMGEALKHHYANNRHHPEHHREGVNGMTLIDIVEMLCDWKAATERHADGDMGKSLEHNANRFSIDPQLAGILKNTAQEMGWLK